jgi:hypothetical protein
MVAVSASRFASALNELATLGGRRMKLLRAHYKVRDRWVSATMLAKKVGYIDYRGFNSCYGHLAAKVEPLVGVRARAHAECWVDPLRTEEGHRQSRSSTTFRRGLCPRAEAAAGKVCRGAPRCPCTTDTARGRMLLHGRTPMPSARLTGGH